MSTLIIGLTGSFGSGCTHTAEAGLMPLDYQYCSLAHELKDHYRPSHPDIDTFNRSRLQDMGDKLRQEKGNDFLAKKVADKIRQGTGDSRWVVDSIRNPHEVAYFKSEFPDFFLFAVFADRDTRWKRVEDKYRAHGLGYDEFVDDDQRDAGENLEYGQRVTDCYILADAMLRNEKKTNNKRVLHLDLKPKLHRLVGLVECTNTFEPDPTEALMAVAFANSRRSSCLKRRVGAVIVDTGGHILSSGYNEVPFRKKDNWNALAETCRQKQGCQRDDVRNDFRQDLAAVLPDVDIPKLMQVFQRRFRNLDLCRALHAEESAILNVARFGSSTLLPGAKLYATTYPCNLCANKIVQVGIDEVIYLEPYPMEEGKKVLDDARITQTPFEGVSFNGYFRFRQEV